VDGAQGPLWDDCTLSRGGNATVPFYRAFLVDRIVVPDVGRRSPLRRERVPLEDQ
jgi:hypothetical protein